MKISEMSVIMQIGIDNGIDEIYIITTAKMIIKLITMITIKLMKEKPKFI